MYENIYDHIYLYVYIYVFIRIHIYMYVCICICSDRENKIVSVNLRCLREVGEKKKMLENENH
jgi:hypothetical protein